MKKADIIKALEKHGCKAESLSNMKVAELKRMLEGFDKLNQSNESIAESEKTALITSPLEKLEDEFVAISNEMREEAKKQAAIIEKIESTKAYEILGYKSLKEYMDGRGHLKLGIGYNQANKLLNAKRFVWCNDCFKNLSTTSAAVIVPYLKDKEHGDANFSKLKEMHNNGIIKDVQSEADIKAAVDNEAVKGTLKRSSSVGRKKSISYGTKDFIADLTPILAAYEHNAKKNTLKTELERIERIREYMKKMK